MGVQSVLFIASEMTPFVKTGGLGDVVGALPKSLAKAGVDVKVIIPLYSCIDYQKFLLNSNFENRVVTI